MPPSNRIMRHTGLYFLLLSCSGLTSAVHADQQPLWEAGLGIGAVMFPDYRGSDVTHAYPVPVPYVIYRGDFFKADRDGVRGLLFNKEYAELNVSVNATVPINSDNNSARHGMPDLKSTVEIGPSLDLHLWHSGDRRLKFDLQLPLRAPLTVEASPQSIGWVFSPHFNLDVADPLGKHGWNLGLAAGPMFADRKYHDYFYSVAPQFANANRPAYVAGGGYSGTQLLGALSKRFATYWVGAYMRYDTLAGAAFEDSPLVKRHSYLSGGIGIAWMIGQSTVMVEETVPSGR